jgi:hypothetical protein
MTHDRAQAKPFKRFFPASPFAPGSSRVLMGSFLQSNNLSGLSRRNRIRSSSTNTSGRGSTVTAARPDWPKNPRRFLPRPRGVPAIKIRRKDLPRKFIAAPAS